MTPDEVRQIIKEELAHFRKDNRYFFERLIQIADGRSIQVGKTTGTKIATEGGASGQKLGFWNKTPITQPSAIAAPSTPSATYDQTEAASAVAAINSIRTALKNMGLIQT